MIKRILILFVIAQLSMMSYSQTPKWAEKAKKAVFSVVTYDANDKILNTGNGFFISEKGVAISDYALFKNAQRAVIITSEGEKMPVKAILGANDMYDVVKFSVDITSKKVANLTLSETPMAEGTKLWLLPYSTQKVRSLTSGNVNSVDKISDYSYYTINLPLKEKMVSCPLMNDEGLVVALAQKASGQDTATICYGVDARFANSQEITAISYNDYALKQIGIKKALPETEDQALIFLYMVSSQVDAEQYSSLLNDFIAQYPNSADGYVRRASNQLILSTDDSSLEKIENDIHQALQITDAKDDVYYNLAKMKYSYLVSGLNNEAKKWSFDGALSDIKQAIAIQDLPIYTQLEGDIHYLKQDYNSALASYKKVNESNIRSASTIFTEAKTLEMLETPAEEVLVLMDSCVAQFNKPYSADAAPYLIERARVRMEAKQARNAVLDYDDCFAALLGNVNDGFYNLRGQACLESKQYQRALDDFTKAIELNPRELTYYSELAYVNMRVGRNQEAIDVLKKSLKIDAEYAEGYRLIGVAYLQLKQNAEACEYFNKAKELGDTNVDTLIDKYCK